MVILIGIVLAILAVLAVLDPIIRRQATPSVVDDEPEDDPRERRKELALAALKEIEFDRATGKLSEGDYQAMLARYTKEAVEALHETEAVAAGGNGHGAPAAAGVAGLAAGAGGGGGGGARAADDAIERLISDARVASKGKRFCSNCGAVLEGSGRFCVECGARV